MLRWLLGTLIGWIVGFFLVFLIGDYILPAIPIHQNTWGPSPLFWDIFLFLALITIAISVGIFQWFVALKGTVKGPIWAGALVAISLLLYLAVKFLDTYNWIPPISNGYARMNCLGEYCVADRLYDTWFTGVLIVSFIVGVCFAIPIWAVFRVYKRAAIWSIVASFSASVATALTHCALVLIIQVDSVVNYTFKLVLGPAVFTIVMGLFIDKILKNRVYQESERAKQN
jgi:hypothetical protein